MRVELKLGRWRERGGGTAVVSDHVEADDCYPWLGTDSVGCPSCWCDDGSWMMSDEKSKHDLVVYLGPLEKKT